MSFQTVAVQSAGDMGHAVGAVLRESGLRVVTSLRGRSELTRERAKRAGIEPVGDLDGVVACADLVLSILPPAAAPAFARALKDAMCRTGRRPLFADANAIAPATALGIAREIGAAGGDFVDAGLIGRPPSGGGPATRLYVSGPRAQELESLALGGPRGALDVRQLGDAIGRASGLKMAYASLTKGTMTLHTAVLIVAQRLGLFPELGRELAESQPAAWKRMGVIPFLPADAGRWIGEMREIASTYREAGVPSGFHEAAEEVFRLLGETPFAAETRESLDRSRTLEQTVSVLAALLEQAQRDEGRREQ